MHGGMLGSIMSFPWVVPSATLFFGLTFCSLVTHASAVQDISNVSPWSQITAQFNLFNSGSGSGSSPPAASTAGRRLLQNSSFADFAPQDTTTSDLTKGGEAA